MINRRRLLQTTAAGAGLAAIASILIRADGSAILRRLL